MNKDTKFILKVVSGILIIISLIFLLVYLLILKPQLQKEEQLKEWCIEKGITCSYYSTPLCYNDCKELGLEYFIIESNGYGKDNLNCWCREGNFTKQIW